LSPISVVQRENFVVIHTVTTKPEEFKDICDIATIEPDIGTNLQWIYIYIYMIYTYSIPVIWFAILIYHPWISTGIHSFIGRLKRQISMGINKKIYAHHHLQSNLIFKYVYCLLCQERDEAHTNESKERAEGSEEEELAAEQSAGHFPASPHGTPIFNFDLNHSIYATK
jgi:hypothetical protein